MLMFTFLSLVRASLCAAVELSFCRLKDAEARREAKKEKKKREIVG